MLGLKRKLQNTKQKFSSEIFKSTSNVRPFLDLKDKLTQIWINQYTLVFCLLAIKVFLFHSSLKSSIRALENNLKSSCVYIDKYGSTLGSLPHYTSKSANKMIATGIQKTHDSVVEGLKLIITGVEEILYFYVEIMLGTYTCLLTAAVDSSVEIATNATESVINFVNGSLNEATNTLEAGLSDLSSVINKVEGAGKDIIDLFKSPDNNDNSTFNKVNLTVESLKKLSIPSSINDKLKALDGKVPSFDEVQNKTKELISIPFEFAKTILENKTSNFVADPNEFFVPDIKDASICPSNSKIEEIFQKIETDSAKVLNIFLVLIILAAFCFMIPLTILTYRKEKKMIRLTKQIHEMHQVKDDKLFNNIHDAIYRNYNSLPSMVSQCICSTFKVKHDTSFKIRWYTNYLMTSSAMNLLALGIAGLFMVFCQYMVLNAAIIGFKKAKGIFANEKFDVESFIFNSVNNWTDHTNNYLQQKESVLNNDIFGPVVNASYTINATISTFYNDLNKVLEDVFNGTLFARPITSVVYCIIGRKLETVEKGLTWIHDNAQVSFPRVNDSMLYYSIYNGSNNSTSLQNKEGSDNTSTITKAENFISDSVKNLINTYKKSLLIEVYVSLALVGLFLIQLLIAFCVFKLNNNKNENLSTSNNYFKENNMVFVKVNKSNETIVNDEDNNPFSNKFEIQEKQWLDSYEIQKK